MDFVDFGVCLLQWYKTVESTACLFQTSTHPLCLTQAVKYWCLVLPEVGAADDSNVFQKVNDAWLDNAYWFMFTLVHVYQLVHVYHLNYHWLWRWSGHDASGAGCVGIVCRARFGGGCNGDG